MIDKDIANSSKAWPFKEAQSVLKRIGGKTPEKGYVLFETGYGPSGLPHIGTFQEVARTAMVQKAFETLAPEIPTKLICFSDDMDGLRKVPTNVPNQEMLEQHIGQPLTKVPNPFDSEYDSFAAHNNAALRSFLDSFGFEYEFISSSKTYQSGRFDEVLLKMLHNYEAVRKTVLPLLGEERAATYSPFLPISPKTGKVLQVPIVEAKESTITFNDEDGQLTEVPVTGGAVKAQWRSDWALRWVALDVDYEMSGSDLKTSSDMAGKITRILGGRKPAGFHYELFLDEDGKKISKSKGNGLTMDEWLKYAPHESLAYYIFGRPSSAKKLYFDVIPKAVDEYLSMAQKLPQQEDAQKLSNPVWYMKDAPTSPISFALLLNLVSVAASDDKNILWEYVLKYSPDAKGFPMVGRLLDYAIAYYKDFIAPHKTFRAPDERERKAIENLIKRLGEISKDATQDELQTEVFSAGKESGYDKSELRDWFAALYQVVLGQDSGPRFGAFIKLYGTQGSIILLKKSLDNCKAA